MAKDGPGLWKKLILRLDGTADSERMKFSSQAGIEWEAELSLHSGTTRQSPRLMVLFRDPARPAVRQRYTLLPPGLPKVPKKAAGQLTEADLRELLAESVEI
jgi:hypothetical protein